MNLSMSWGRNFVQSFIMSFTDSGMFCSHGLFPNPRSFRINAAIFVRMSSSLWVRKYRVKAGGPVFSDLSRVSHSSMNAVAFLLNCSSEPAQINPLVALKRSSQMRDTRQAKSSTVLLYSSSTKDVTKQRCCIPETGSKGIR